MSFAGWNDSNVEVLKAAVAEGLAFSQIANRIGCTRSAAIGKARRLGFEQPARPQVARYMPPPPTPAVRRQVAFGANPGTPKPAPPLPEPYAPVGTSNLLIHELGAFGCRWPTNMAKPFEEHRFCGRRQAVGRPYCEEHVRRAYVAPPGKKRADQDKRSLYLAERYG